MTRIVLFYLTSFGTSLLGNSITAIALPLLVLFTTGSPLGAGAVAVAAAVPSAAAGLLMGSLVDRINRRTAALLSDVISAVALVILPIVDLTVGLHLGWFIAVAVLNSFGDVPGITAREAMLPAIARAARMNPSRLIGLRESLSGVAFLVGPGIAGVLVAALQPVAVMWITSGIAGLAAVLTLGISRAVTARQRVQRDGGEQAGPASAGELEQAGAAGEGVAAGESAGSVFDGLRIIARTPVLRVLVLLNLALAVVLASTQGMVIPVHFAFLDQAQYVGFVLSALAAGLLVGGALFSVLGDRIPRRAWFVGAILIVAAGFVIIGILGPVWSIFTGAAIVGLGGGCMNAVVGLTFVEQVEDAHRGRVLGAQNAVLTLVPAAGIGGASVLIEVGGLHVTTAVLAALWIVAGTLCLLTPSLRRMWTGHS